MDKALVLGLVRHAVTGFGMYLAGSGFFEESQITELTGAIMTLVSVGWFVVEKLKSQKAGK